MCSSATRRVQRSTDGKSWGKGVIKARGRESIASQQDHDQETAQATAGFVFAGLLATFKSG